MANKLYQESAIQDIAAAIREKNGSSATYKVAEMGTAIRAIQGENESVNIPTYHYVEALRVAKKISEWKAAHPNNLVFGAVSDIHILNNDATYEEKSKKAIKHAAFALETVGAMVGADFIANLGDNCWENGIDTDNAYIGAQFSINACKPAFERLTRFNLVGNHDKSNDTQGQYDLIGSWNDFDAWGYTKIRGFGYKDFTAKKVRVICLNTADYLNASGGCALSYDQKDFLMRALDLSAKSDAAQWQILLLSHIPLDWQGGDYRYYDHLSAILEGYEEGSLFVEIGVINSYALNETPSNYATYNSTYNVLEYSYSGKNSAKIIANIHGHVHTNKVGKLIASYKNELNIARIATPNTNPDLNKSESYPNYGDYSISSEEAAKIVKVQNTAKDTSATFYCIDLDEEVIYAIGYGADIDREIAYTSLPTYTIEYNLTSCTSSNTSAVAVENSAFTTTLFHDDEATLSSVVVTMGGVEVTSQYYNADTKTISIPAVTGNVVITAVAKVAAWSETITDIAVATRSVWAIASSGGVPNLVNSNGEGAIGVTTPNNYANTDREGKTVYVMPVNAKAVDVTVNNTDGKSCTYNFVGLKDNGGTFAVIFTSGKKTDNTRTFSAGSISHILISMERTDGSSFEWGYNDSQITVKFTNGVADSGGGEDEPTYTNIIDEVGTIDNVRLRSGGATGEAAGFASNYFPVKAGDIIRVQFPNGARASIPSNGVYCCLYSDNAGTLVAAYDSSNTLVVKNMTDTGYEIHIPTSVTCSYARVAGGANGRYAGWIVTVNEPIK